MHLLKDCKIVSKHDSEQDENALVIYDKIIINFDKDTIANVSDATIFPEFNNSELGKTIVLSSIINSAKQRQKLRWSIYVEKS